MQKLTYAAVVAACVLAYREKRLQAQYELPGGWQKTCLMIGGEHSEQDDVVPDARNYPSRMPVLVNALGAALQPEHIAFIKAVNARQRLPNPLDMFAVEHCFPDLVESIDGNKIWNLHLTFNRWLFATDEASRKKFRKAFKDLIGIN